MSKQSNNYSPILLTKTSSFPMYQLYATVENPKTTPQDALKIGVLTVFSWLRERARKFEGSFKEINLPEPKSFPCDVPLKSFRINLGYTIHVVYIKDEFKESWSFCLTEPDSGKEASKNSPARSALPGRLFETNIAFIIKGDGPLECGFNVVCVEPEGTTETCEVFRISPVKYMFRNERLGIKQVWNIIEDTYKIIDTKGINNLKDFVNNNKRQLPFVLIAEHCPTELEPDIEKIANDFLAVSKNEGYRMKSELSIDKVADEKVISDQALLPFDPVNLFSYKAGFAQFGVLSANKIDAYNEIFGPAFRMEEGDVQVFFPLEINEGDDKPENSRIYKHSSIAADPKGFCKKLSDFLENYPKYKKINYGNVRFVMDASIEEQQGFIDSAKSFDELKDALTKQKDDEILAVRKQGQHDVNTQKQLVAEKNKTIKRLEDEILDAEKKLEAERAKSSASEEKHARQIEILQLENERLKRRTCRPNDPCDVSSWANQEFQERLIIHQRGENLLKNLHRSDVDVQRLCDALEYLAFEYRDFRTGLLNEIERDNKCSANYNRRFEVSPSGEDSVRSNPVDFKVKYGEGFKGKPVEHKLDMHLRVGGDPKDLLRIYFFFDENKKIIVVGSLPKHL